MQATTADVLNQLAPQGVLHAAINYGNPVLAQRAADGSAKGVSVELAQALADELGVSLQLHTFDAAGKVFAALEEDTWRVAFLAIEPVRAEQIAFSDPYVIIEGTYLVAVDAPYQRVADLDQPGVTIAVGNGAAYDLFLSRTLQQATLQRADTSAAAIDVFLEGHLDAAAGVRQPLQKAAEATSGYRVLDDAFTSIRQAMAVPRAHQAAAAYVQSFIDAKKTDGFVRAALVASGQGDVQVAD